MQCTADNGNINFSGSNLGTTQPNTQMAACARAALTKPGVTPSQVENVSSFIAKLFARNAFLREPREASVGVCCGWPSGPPVMCVWVWLQPASPCGGCPPTTGTPFPYGGLLNSSNPLSQADSWVSQQQVPPEPQLQQRHQKAESS